MRALLTFRMVFWVVLTFALLGLALLAQGVWQGTLLAVTFYKAHLMALGGWGGYWLDRALFPYARPDKFIRKRVEGDEFFVPGRQTFDIDAFTFASSQLRRAVIVAACLICVGLGA